MSYLEQNKILLAKLEQQYKNKVYPKNLPQAYSDSPWEFGYDVKAIGIVCSHCGGKITSKNLEFYNFSPDVKCYTCQNNQSK